MARDYAVIWSTFWTGETGRTLRKKPDLQLLALYLMTSPHASMIGAYYLPIPYIVHDIGCPSEGASKGLRRLSEGYFCTYDEATEWVWVHEMAKFQVGEPLDAKDKRLSAIRTLYEKLPPGLIASGFFARYGASYGLDEPKPLASPSEGASIPLRSQNQEQEQNKEQKEADKPPRVSRVDAMEIPPALAVPEFLEAWQKWESYRVEGKHRITPLSRTQQLKALSSWGVAGAVASIESSIRNGWQGLFEPKPNGNGNGKPTTPKKELTPEQIEKNRLAHEVSRRQLEEDARLQREEVAARKAQEAAERSAA